MRSTKTVTVKKKTTRKKEINIKSVNLYRENLEIMTVDHICRIYETRTDLYDF